MNKRRFFIFAGAFAAFVVAGGIFGAIKLHADESNSTQPDQPATFVMLAGKLDVTSQFSGQPYAMNTIVLLNNQTGQMWMLQAEVNQNNNPQINAANLIPVNFSNGPTQVKPVEPTESLNQL